MVDMKNSLSGVQENVPLAQYTTFRIGGPARYFFVAKNIEDAKKAVQAAQKEKIPHYIIGNGSNLLFSDNGFDGLVIKMLNTEYRILGTNVICDSGVLLGRIISETAKNSLAGFEWMVGIPGTIGGAIYGNAGAFGHSISGNINRVEVLDLSDLSQKYLSKDECKFSYRSSVFKEKKYIILRAEFVLSKGATEEVRNVTKEYLSKRSVRHPAGPSAGSIFKNPSIAENKKAYEGILKKFHDAGKFKTSGTLPAGWLIEQCGLLGKRIGGAEISKQHGNFIINAGGAKATDIIILISLIKQKIRVNFGIQLEEEIQYAGF